MTCAKSSNESAFHLNSPSLSWPDFKVLASSSRGCLTREEPDVKLDTALWPVCQLIITATTARHQMVESRVNGNFYDTSGARERKLKTLSGSY